MLDINMVSPLELCMEAGSVRCALILLPYKCHYGPAFLAAIDNYRFYAIDYLYKDYW